MICGKCIMGELGKSGNREIRPLKTSWKDDGYLNEGGSVGHRENPRILDVFVVETTECFHVLDVGSKG